MKNKKSYMDSKNILNEGFFNALKNILAIVGAKTVWDASQKKTIKKKMKADSKLKALLALLNRDQSKLEKLLKQNYGADVKLDRYKFGDFQ